VSAPGSFSPLVGAALSLAAEGFAVFPCAGKDPLVEHGFHAATTDQNQIAAWWAQWPNANPAIAVPLGFAVVDLDPRNAPEAPTNPDGSKIYGLPAEVREPILAALRSKLGALPDTRIAESGDGGFHYWFRLPEGLTLPGKLAQGIDVKIGGRGYVVAPGAVHPITGRQYRWASTAPIAAAPDWLVARGRIGGQLSPEAVARMLDEDDRKLDETAVHALAAQLAPHYAAGKRHDVAKNLGGWLKQRGCTPADVRAVVELLPSTDHEARVKAALAAFDIAQPFGWTELSELIGASVAAALDASTPNPKRTDDQAWSALMAEVVAKHGAEAPKAMPPTGALASRWVRLGEAPTLLLETPPPQRWLLMQDGVGMLPRGRCGLLASTGGVGKTYSLIDLAIAVALGDKWLGTFDAPEPGHVLLALAEEDLDEARRRLWKTCNARQLSPAQRHLVAARLDVLPLAGASVALTTAGAGGAAVPTPTVGELHGQLCARCVPWALVVLDPLSRWAGGGVEADNENATRFVQVIETLTGVPGRPTVLVAHHSSKTSAKEGAADARGVTGLGDGFRWRATMDEVVRDDFKGVRLSNPKNNYARRFDPVFLLRSELPGTEGTLRPADPGRGPSPLGDSIPARVLRTVAVTPGLRSATAIAERTRGRKGEVLEAIKELLGTGQLRKDANGFSAVPTREPGTANDS